MNLKYILAGLVVATTANSPDETLARARDYAFQPVSVEVKKGEDVTIAVRLIRKVTRKPVVDAVVTPVRIDMAGMAEMTSPVTVLPASEPGVYAFKTNLSMEGRWRFSVTAKVPGERDAVVGRVVLKATQ